MNGFDFAAAVRANARWQSTPLLALTSHTSAKDLERGRPMEIDPLVTVVQEMGKLTKMPTPSIDTVLALVVQRANVAGLY